MDIATETTNIDELIDRFFEAFDNRNSRLPTCAEIADLFVEDAVILYRTEGETRKLTVSEFAEPRVALLTSGKLINFHEWETSNTTNTFDSFAVRISAYSKSGSLESRPYKGRGTKLFQLANLGGEWRIASLCWFDVSE